MTQDANKAVEQARDRRRSERLARQVFAVHKRAEKWPPWDWAARFNRKEAGNHLEVKR